MKITPRYEFADLATYNAEVARGILHSFAYHERMRAEQERFDMTNRLKPCVVCGHPATWSFSAFGGPSSQGVTACDDCSELVAASHA